MSYKEIIDNVSNIEDLDNTTILKVLEKFAKTIKDFAIEQSGLNNLANVEFIPSDNNTTYTGDSVDYLGTLKLTLSDNIIVNKPCNIKFNIKGSNTIVVDVDEFNNSLELHLDNSVVTTLDFAESERQKSKNLLVYPYTGKNASPDITITENGDGSFTINGQKTLTDKNSAYFLYTFNNLTDKISSFKLSAGTYTGKVFASVDADIQLVLTDGSMYQNINVNKNTTFTVAKDTYFEIYLQVPKHNTSVFNNLVVYPMIVKGTDLGDWQPYNGSIVHEKEIADVEHIETIYDIETKNSINGTAYTSGIAPNTTISNLALSKYKTLRILFGNYGNLQYQGFLTLNIEGIGHREIQSTLWNFNYQVDVNNLGDTSSLTNNSSADCIIRRIEGVY